jgi:hypothetical protein
MLRARIWMWPSAFIVRNLTDHPGESATERDGDDVKRQVLTHRQRYIDAVDQQILDDAGDAEVALVLGVVPRLRQ